MYRAIPEVSHICSMAERSRQYRLHQEALARISMRSKPRAPAPRSTSTICHQPLRPYSLRGKAQKEEEMRIQHENEKMKNALLRCGPTIKRKEMILFEKDHEHQVKRMTGFRKEVYGFSPEEKPANAKRPMKKPGVIEPRKEEPIMEEQPPKPAPAPVKPPQPKPVQPVQPVQPPKVASPPPEPKIASPPPEKVASPPPEQAASPPPQSPPPEEGAGAEEEQGAVEFDL